MNQPKQATVTTVAVAPIEVAENEGSVSAVRCPLCRKRLRGAAETSGGGDNPAAPIEANDATVSPVGCPPKVERS